jgi:pyruvate dehydrogenase E2 component (dihydrolipoamide acetyltransferase)
MAPGDSLAEVETDKASMTFESQDEFYVAKILVEQGAEVKVGDPIMVTVEEAADVAAFANFTIAAAPAAPAVTAPPAAPTPAPSPAAPKPVETPKPAPAAATPVPPTPSKVPETPKPVPAKPAAGAATFVYGSGILKGALANRLASEQKAYLAKYGRSVHSPIKIPSPAK